MFKRSGAFAVEHIKYQQVALTDGIGSDSLYSFCQEANARNHLPNEDQWDLFSMYR